MICFFFFNDTATTEIYTYFHTLSLHDALPISFADERETRPAAPHRPPAVRPRFCRARSRPFASARSGYARARPSAPQPRAAPQGGQTLRSEEHTSELQSLMRISYAVFCLKKKKKQ